MKKRPNWKSAVIPAALVLMSAGGLSALASTAVFGSESAPASNSFTSGTVDITTAPAKAAIAMANMAPGDADYGTIQVTNSGSLEQRYAVKTVATNTGKISLSDTLVVTVKEGVTACTAAGFAATGKVLYGPGSMTAMALGNPSQGQQTGDRILAAQATETLCIKAELPVSVSNDIQGSATTATFNFNAEQTRNNK